MFTPGLVGSITTVLQDLNIDQLVIDDVVNTLRKSSSYLDNSRFPDLHVPESSFGGSAQGAALGYHHIKAHQVITDTLEGVVLDLQRFGDGIRNAEKLVRVADTDAAANLDKKRQATELLVTATQYSQGDRDNHQARNEHLPNGGDA